MCNARRNLKQRGASLLEFAILLPLSLLLLGFLLDLSQILFHYSLVNHTATFMARRLALDTEGASSQSQMNSSSQSRLAQYVEDTFGFPRGAYSFTSTVTPDGSGSCRLNITVTRHYSCLFCQAISQSVDLQSSGSWLIEDPCYTGGC